MKKLFWWGLGISLVLFLGTAPASRAQEPILYQEVAPGYPGSTWVLPQIQWGFHGFYIFQVDGHYEKGWDVSMADSGGLGGSVSIWISPNLIFDGGLDYLWFSPNNFSVDNIWLFPGTVGLRGGGFIAENMFIYAGGGIGITGGWTDRSGINMDYTWLYYACGGLELRLSPWVALRPEFRYTWCNPNIDWDDGPDYSIRLDHMQIRGGLVFNF